MRKYAWILGAAAIAVVLLVAAALYVAAGSAEQGRAADVAPRSSLDEYSWGELAAIAEEIGACSDESQAIDTAARYGLCAADGSLSAGGPKEIALADGSAVHVRLAGIWHDERADGGCAGLSFVFADAAGEHAMNHAFEDADAEAPDSTGGWSASDMRVWLNGDFFRDLPSDLRNAIVAVQKPTASRVGSAAELAEAGHLAGSGVDWVDETTDKIWLLSAAELCGRVPENDTLGVDDAMADVYAAEGAQYRLFADAQVAAFAPNELLVRHSAVGEAPCTWWLRTKTLEFGDGFWLVGTDGAPLSGLGEDARAAQDPEFAPDEL